MARQLPRHFIYLLSNRIKLTAILLAPLLLVTGSPVSAQIEMLDQVVAIVDDDIILASELQERIQGVRGQMEARGVDVPEEEVLVRETLDRLILDSIQLQLANRYGVRIPDQQLDESMTRLAKQNGLSLEQFRIALEQSGQSYAVARESLRDDLAIQRVQQGNVMRNINITEQEIDNFLATEEGEALTQPEFRVVQALLSTGRNEDSVTVAAKRTLRRRHFKHHPIWYALRGGRLGDTALRLLWR
jgi:peptidyl-prolyl cis-trans isomerase SurA